MARVSRKAYRERWRRLRESFAGLEERLFKCVDEIDERDARLREQAEILARCEDVARRAFAGELTAPEVAYAVADILGVEEADADTAGGDTGIAGALPRSGPDGD